MHKTRFSDHVILSLGCIVMIGPVIVLVVGAFQAGGTDLFRQLWFGTDALVFGLPARDMMLNSLVLAGGVASLMTAVSFLAAYALVFFRLPGQQIIFTMILVAMFFPIETRIIPSFLVVDALGLLNSYTGMILPIVANGFGVLVFRQYLRQIPGEVIEAARIDGAGPLRVMRDIVGPMSLPMATALFAVFFVLGWNQYVWPLMVTTTSAEHITIVQGMERAAFAGPQGMALAVLALIPPGLMLLALQRWLVRGLTAGIH